MKNIEDVKREQAVSFLVAKREKGLSHSTIAKDTAAINKIFDYQITKKDTGNGNRSNHTITRGRRINQEASYLQRERANQQQIDIIKAFGMRRQSIEPSRTNYPITPTSLFKRDGEIYCSLIEKGGKYREVKCLQAHKSLIEERYTIMVTDQNRTKESFKQLYFENKEPTIFESFDKNITAHAYRAEFACELYKQIEQQYIEKTRSVERDFNGYNRQICCEVAKELGHGNNRPEVFVTNYSYGFERI